MPKISKAVQDKVATSIYDSKLLKFGEFTLKSGIISPFYIDLRAAQSHPDTFSAIIDAYSEMLENTAKTTFIAGVPEAGTPFAAAVGFKLHRPLIQPRKVIKTHGTKSSIEGDFKRGDHVILLDDLITKGDSKLEAIRQAEDVGLVIEKFVVLIDREQGGLETVRQAGYKIEAAFSISTLIAMLYGQNKITRPQLDTILDFIKQN